MSVLTVRTSIQVTLISALWTAISAFSQCSNQITLVPLTKQKAAIKSREFVRFKYPLSDSDSILIRSHEDTTTSIGPYDTGFVIMRNNHALQSMSVNTALKSQHKAADTADAFLTLAVTQACTGQSPIFFISMQSMGDEISPALLFVIVPGGSGYVVSALPTISGGVLDVSRANPLHLKTWSSLHEGQCNACETAYEITNYEVRDGKPVRTARHRTRHLYSSSNFIFDDRRRIRFIP